MNEQVREWLSKADGDLRVMRRELAVTDGPVYDVVCFHAQQCVEKTMKAVLIDARVDFPKIHDLAELALRISAVHPAWSWDTSNLDNLTWGAVDSRYASDEATLAEAQEAAGQCEAIRTALLALLSSA